jgi:hypothetical protein
MPIRSREPAKDIDWLQNQEIRWPYWPFCPIVRRSDNGGAPEAAVVHANDVTRVVVSNVFALPKTYEEFEKLPHQQYASVEAIIDDGWEVD